MNNDTNLTLTDLSNDLANATDDQLYEFLLDTVAAKVLIKLHRRDVGPINSKATKGEVADGVAAALQTKRQLARCRQHLIVEIPRARDLDALYGLLDLARRNGLTLGDVTVVGQTLPSFHRGVPNGGVAPAPTVDQVLRADMADVLHAEILSFDDERMLIMGDGRDLLAAEIVPRNDVDKRRDADHADALAENDAREAADSCQHCGVGDGLVNVKSTKGDQLLCATCADVAPAPWETARVVDPGVLPNEIPGNTADIEARALSNGVPPAVAAAMAADAIKPDKPKAKRAGSVKPRDPRLPEPGTVLTGMYKGASFSVTVGKGNDCTGPDGTVYRSLSGASNAFTGHQTNGFRFFGLVGNAPRKRSSGQPARPRTTKADLVAALEAIVMARQAYHGRDCCPDALADIARDALAGKWGGIANGTAHPADEIADNRRQLDAMEAEGAQLSARIDDINNNL